MIYRLLYVITAGAALAGCASSPGDDLSPFGSSLRQTIAAQTWHKGDPAPTLHGDKAAGDMEAYRTQNASQSDSAESMSVKIEGN